MVCQLPISMGTEFGYVGTRVGHARCIKMMGAAGVAKAFDRAVREEPSEAPPAERDGRKDSLWHEQLSDARVGQARRCVDGICGVVHLKVMCLRCKTRGVHPGCAHVSKGHAVLGSVISRATFVGFASSATERKARANSWFGEQ